MNLNLIGKLGLVVAGTVACLSLGSGIARADSVTYTFTGAGVLSGTDFTYISPSGFLSLSNNILAPNTTTDLFVSGTDEGGITAFLVLPHSPLLSPTTQFISIDLGPINEVGFATTGLDPTHFATETIDSFDTGAPLFTLAITPTVPEIDPKNSMAPFALLAGAVLIIRGRRKISTSESRV